MVRRIVHKVEWTMRAEMLTELRRYNPAKPTEGSTQVRKMLLSNVNPGADTHLKQRLQC